MTENWPTQSGELMLGDLVIQHGHLYGARLAWKSYGTLNAARDNVIVYPTSYSAGHADQEWLIGPDRILDPTRYFIVIPNMFANGMSSSPTNTPSYPKLVTSWDNVQAQRRLLRDQWGVERVACVYGFSMGAQQAYHWAAAFPGAVERIVAVCGTARTSVHNKVFLLGLQAILEASPEYLYDGQFSGEPREAMRAFARNYAAWALSQDFYREDLHRTALGAPDLATFLRTDWEERMGKKPAANMYAQLKTWEHGDISANPLYDGDLERALRSIEARVLLMPSETDLYFRVADNAAELPHLRRAELRVIPSVWGHRAGAPSTNPADEAFIRDAVRAWLHA